MEFGMQDTLEYYTLFHLSLRFEGPEAMLAMVLMTVMFMLFSLLQYDRVARIIDECAVRRLN